MNDIQDALKKRYSDLHPLIFHRSLDKTKTNGELFDILETNSGYINNFDNLNLAKLKTLLVITNILEEKLNCETINIIESK